MSYVIVNKETKRLYVKRNHVNPEQYLTMRGAKIACTKLNKKAKKDSWVAMSGVEYRETYPVKMVKRRNLMTGKEYMEAEDTPLCCSPASETYWSM